MHADLLVFLAAAWLGPALADGRRALGDASQPLALLSLVAAALVAGLSTSGQWMLATTALAFAAVLLSFGFALARDGRRAGLRRLAIAALAGAIAVMAQALLGPQPVATALAGVALPASLLLLLAPAAARLEVRLREHDLGPRAHPGVSRALSTGILALAFAPVLQSLPGSPW